MKNLKRICALILCVAFVLSMFVSAAYLIREAGHHCCKDDCPICHTIAMATKLLRAFKLLIPVFFIASVAAAGRCIRQRGFGFVIPGCGTLVSWKIRLND